MPRLRRADPLIRDLAEKPAAPEDAELVRRYVLWRQVAKHRDPHTVEQDERWLRVWVAILASRDHRLLAATTEDAMEMAARLDDRDWSASHRAKAVTCLRMFYDWLIDRELMRDNPWRKIDRPKVENPVRMPLAVEEFDALAAQFDRPTLSNLTYRAVVEVLYSSGCRIGEVLGLNRADVDLVHGHLLVLGKGRRQRIAYLTERAVDHLRRYLLHARPQLVQGRHGDGANGPVFLGKHGRRLKPGVFNEALHTAARRAGITKPVFAHLLRHSVATELLNAGADLRRVQEFLGHKRIATTEIYTHVATRQIEEMHRRLHPLPN